MTTPNIEELIARLQKSSIEIESAGHYGWGNTCTDALNAMQSQAERIKELNLQVVSAFGQAQEALEERDALRAQLDALPAQPVEPVNAELVEALKANHQWHLDHDDYGGYLESDLWQQTQDALSSAQAAPAVGVPDADLQARCKEILIWQRTGILPNGVLRTYAGSKDYSTQHNCLQIAEAATVKEAFEYIASTQPQQKEG